MDRDRPKNLVVIGGPNGAGKTTWAVNRLSAPLSISEFVNADDVVIRRYSTGLRNLRRLYLPLADVAIIFDNSDGSEALIAERRYNGSFIIFDEPRWRLIEEATR